MDKSNVFRCTICHGVIGKPYIGLDRRTQRYEQGSWKGKLQTVVTTLDALEMFRYDSPDCWQLHQPQVVAELQLISTYPSGATVVPCSRCGAPVDRKLPHISYAVVEMELSETSRGLTGKVIDDKELAVLCRDCEEPDEPSAEVGAELQHQEERTRA